MLSGIKVCFLVSDNGFSHIFCKFCLNVDEIFFWHNLAFSLWQNGQQKFLKSVDK